MRGFAALAVALFHFSHGNPSLAVPRIVYALGTYGWLGVEMFFVISGFILPYSLHTGGYMPTLTNFRRFVWKRLIRLEPPYLCSIAVIVILTVLAERAPGFRGVPDHWTAAGLAAHIGYLNNLLGLPALSPVFWTLGIEFQFYLLVPLIYPLFSSDDRAVRLTALASLLALYLLFPNGQTVCSYFALFVCGIAVFQSYAGICGRSETVSVIVSAACLIARNERIPAALTCLFTALMIRCFPNRTNRILAFLGTLSYSIYLIHVPIGGRVINLASRLPKTGTVALGAIAVALAVTIGAAWLLWRSVERPAQRYAASVRFQCAALPSQSSR